LFDLLNLGRNFEGLFVRITIAVRLGIRRNHYFINLSFISSLSQNIFSKLISRCINFSVIFFKIIYYSNIFLKKLISLLHTINKG